MNRANETDVNNPVCKVVYSSHQFSWTLKKRSTPKEKEALDKAKLIAYKYLRGRKNNQVGSRKYFNHKRMGKRYKTPNKPIVLGKLVFY